MTHPQTSPLAASIRLGIRQLVSRPLYLLMMVGVPLLFCLGFVNLLDDGLPKKSPIAVVDLDGSTASRTLAANINSQELVSVDYSVDSYTDAMKLMDQGRIFAFFLIPRDFAADAGANRPTTIPFYCNMAYFVPGTMAYRNIMQTAVTAKGELVAATAVGAGISEGTVQNLLVPVNPQTHGIGNPWMNYNIYLSNSFVPCMLQLVIFQITIFTLLIGIKRRTSDRLLQAAGGSVIKAVLGKLIPQFVIFLAVGLALLGIMYGFNHFPLNGSLAGMVLAMALLVLSSQAFGLFVAALLPNLRLALSLASLVGILAFSIAGFSYPVEDMYPALGIFSYILPVRYYFLIYVNTALNGYELHYVWNYFIDMALFLIPPVFVLPHLRRHWAKPVYIP